MLPRQPASSAAIKRNTQPRRWRFATALCATARASSTRTSLRPNVKVVEVEEWFCHPYSPTAIATTRMFYVALRDLEGGPASTCCRASTSSLSPNLQQLQPAEAHNHAS
mmetsp:Transcript_30832/g.63863  ORF Transcript_30832/g.63863 Transcript_30832/m.63863 type:complete len:109 (-) Transcript_30832:1127-1453(-)